MSEVKWIKITTNMFDDEKIRLIEAMPDADSILVIWIKLLTLAGKVNEGGSIVLDENIPYTDEMLSTIFRRPLNTIRLAISIFVKFNMIETTGNNVILITNWEKHQNIGGLEKIKEQSRISSRKYRERQKLLSVTSPSRDVTKQNKNKNKNKKDIKAQPPADLSTTKKKEPFPAPTPEQKKKLAKLQASLKPLRFDLFLFMAFVRKQKGYFPPVELIIRTSETVLEKRPDNTWGYYVQVLKKEVPIYFADLAEKENTKFKNQPTGLKNILDKIGK